MRSAFLTYSNKTKFTFVGLLTIFLIPLHILAQSSHQKNEKECFVTGQQKLVYIPGEVTNVYPFGRGQAVLVSRDNGILELGILSKDSLITKLNSSTLKTIPNSDGSFPKITDVTTSADSNLSLIQIDREFYIFDSTSSEFNKLDEDISSGGFFSQNNKYLIFQSGKSMKIYDVKKRRTKTIFDVSNKTLIYVDKESSNLLRIELSELPRKVSSVHVYDFRSESKTLFQSSKNKISFSSTPSALILKIDDKSFDLFLPEYTNSKFDKAEISEGFKRSRITDSWGNSYDQDIFMSSLKLQDGANSIDIELPAMNYEKRQAGLLTDNYIAFWSASGDYTTVHLSEKNNYVCAQKKELLCKDCNITKLISEKQTWATALGQQTALTCNAINDIKNLQAPSGIVSGTQIHLNEVELAKTLFAFSRPGGFVPANDISTLVAILQNKDLMSSYGNAISSVMTNVMATSSNLYSVLSKKFPQIRALTPSKLGCANESTKNYFSKNVLPILRSDLLYGPPVRRFEEYGYFSQFQSLMDEAEKIDIASLIADSTTAYVEHYDQEMSAVFHSKIYHFAYQKARQLMGLKSGELTDLSLIYNLRGRKSHKAVLLSTKPIEGLEEGSEYSAAGFYVTKIKNPIDTNINFGESTKSHLVRWATQGQHFYANINMKRVDKSDNTVPIEYEFRKNELISDGVLRGVVIAGSNLGIGKSTLDEYVSYYKNEGFIFDQEVRLPDTVGYLKDKVTGNSYMDYFVKEAHSDGDEKNLFRVTKTAILIKGIKNHGPHKEVIEIVYPSSNSGTELISNQLFGEWIRDREKSGGGQLIYINSSCSSHTKAVAELSATHSRVLTEIPTLSLAYTFVDYDKSVLRIIVDGIRNFKSFEAIRENLKINKGYNDNTSDVYIFPDEKKYDDIIRSSIYFPVDFKIELFEYSKNQKSWQPYFVDERIVE